KVCQRHLPAVDINMTTVIFERAINEAKIVQSRTAARSSASGIATSREICRRQLNPDSELIMVGDEMRVLEAQVFYRRGATVAHRQRAGIAIIDEPFHDKILDAFASAATVKGPSVVHGHGEAIFDQDMTGAGSKVIGIVMVLLLAVDDLKVVRGEILAAADGHSPVGGAQEQQVLEGNIAAIVDHVAPDAIARIVDFSVCVSGPSVTRVGLEVVPQPWVALHINRAPPPQTRILDIVKHEKRSGRPSSGSRRRRGVILSLAGPPNQRASVHVKRNI